MCINHRKTSKAFKRTFHRSLEAFCSAKRSFPAKMRFSLMYGGHVFFGVNPTYGVLPYSIIGF